MPVINKKYALAFVFYIALFNTILAQRSYAPNSVLATGNWYKIATKQAGVYKIDVPFLASLGINVNNLSSSSIQVFSNNEVLEEKNSLFRYDDLQENALAMVDGGDGIFNNNDYFLFYATSADKWIKDSANFKFTHQKSIYADSTYYFITLGTNGKRIAIKNTLAVPNKTVNTFNDRYFYETDLVNFLNSGKEWFGEEFSSLPGSSLSKNFTLNFDGLDIAQPIIFASNFASRSIGAQSNFVVNVNGQNVQNINLSGISGFYLDAFATTKFTQSNFNANSSTLNISIGFTPANFDAQGWLNWFEILCKRSLSLANQNQLSFRDWASVGANNIAEFTLSNTTATTEVWDISNVFIPEKMSTNFSNLQTKFVNEAFRLKEYIAFNYTNFFTPSIVAKIANQNLHNTTTKDYLIIAPNAFMADAKKLALFHTQKYNYKVLVASVEEVYNEFGGGAKNTVAIRDFVKMYYDKALGDTTKQPKYLLLFGAASFDYKNRINNNTNFVACYESSNSTEPLVSHTSDDFFGFLDDMDDVNDFVNPSLLDIAVARIPIKNNEEAKVVVDKIINYHTANSFGDWKNNTIFVADDKDGNTHLNDAEVITNNVAATNNIFNQHKVYLDAHTLVSGSGGGRYPTVNASIINQIFTGALIFNYNGHGGYQRLADEAILGQQEVNEFKNPNKLPLFITATCDFAPFDDPTKNALGSSLLTKNSTGAIALLTTSRVVFAFSNRVINDNFLKIALQSNVNNKYLTLGQALKKAKNTTYATLADVVNNRKFALIGDPAMQLAFPEYKAQLLQINQQNITGTDTLKALNKYTISGNIINELGQLQTNFNGTISTTIFDKTQNIKTLGNDVASPVVNFNQQTNILYKGKSTVTNGLFTCTFTVPKDVGNAVGKGRLSLYANSNNTDANGVSTNFFVGGVGNYILNDTKGPDIKPFLNDEKFANGGLVNEKPILIAKLFDSSGINTVGTGIGHDIVVTIDGDDKNAIVVNNYYQANLNSYTSGIVTFQLPTLSNGHHFLKIKAWDVANNSNETILEFVVAQSDALKISHVYNYPNPFSTKTSFWVNHNQPSNTFLVTINVFSITGKLVHQIIRTVTSVGNRISEIEWDGKDGNSEKLAKGVYIYQIIVKNTFGQTAQATQKLFLF